MFTAALLTIAKIWKQPMCPINREVDKENVAYTYNGMKKILPFDLLYNIVPIVSHMVLCTSNTIPC